MAKLEEALEDLDLESWLNDYTEITFRNDGEIRIRVCPVCLNDKSKLYVSVEKKLFYCQRCGFGKGIRDICRLMAEVSGRHLNDIKIELAQTVSPAKKENEFESAVQDKIKPDKTLDAPEPIDTVSLPQTEPFEGVTGTRAYNYLLKRGLSEEIIKERQLAMVGSLRGHSGPYVLFPVNYFGLTVAYQGRCIVDKDPKYVSSENIKQWLWPLDQLKEQDTIVIVEGVFDALGYLSVGVPAVCTFGKKISTSQIELLQKHKIKNVYFAWDPDAHQDIQDAADKLAHLFSVYIIPFPEESKLKLDPGLVLQYPELKPWLKETLDTAIYTDSGDYWLWKLQRKIK